MFCDSCILYHQESVIKSRVPDNNLVSEIQFPRISFPFIVVVGIVEHAEYMAQASHDSIEPSNEKESETVVYCDQARSNVN